MLIKKQKSKLWLTLLKKANQHFVKFTEAAIQRCSLERVFWKDAANLL